MVDFKDKKINKIKLENLDNISKLEGKQSDGAAYEQNNLRYDCQGLLLLNEHNGVELITQQIAEIISATNSKHDVLSALEGGLGYYGFSKEERKTILFDALKITNYYKSKHRNRIKRSIISKKKRKRGFPYLKRNYSHIESQINIIINIRHIFWEQHSAVEYQLMEITYAALIDKLVEIFPENEEIPSLLDSYLKMKGVGVHERYKLIKQSFEKFEVDNIEKFILDEINYDNKPHNEHALITKHGINLGTNINNKLRRNEFKHHTWQLYKLANNLDIQLSLISYNGRYPKIQPLINLVERPKGLEPYKRRQEATNFLKQNNNLKKTKEGNYIFDDVDTNSYIPIDANKLGNYLSKKYPILRLGIESNELDMMLNSSGIFDELHHEYYIFNNGVLNLHEREFIKTTDFTEFFTTKKMDCNFDIDNLTIDPLNSEPACLVDRVLREIFIPNYKKDAKDQFIGYYMDFLQRLGSAFNTRIKEKKFPCYYGFGDNGKDIVIEILKIAFGDRCLLVTMDILQDEKADLSEYDIVIIDELDKKTFKDAIAFIKRITGGEEEGTAKRKHYSHEVFRPKNPSAFFLFTNEIPDVPLNETAFYRREDALELKNRFIDNPNPKKTNEFQADSSLKDKIKNAKEDSLEWLINAALKAYYDCFDENGYFKGFTMAQTAEETKMIVSNTDPLTKFLRESYEEDELKEETVTNQELRDNYENYCNRNNLSCDTSNLAINMGNAVKKVFGDVKKKTSNDTRYYLIPKDESDLLTTYHLCKDKEWWQVIDLMPEETFEAHEKVYNRFVMFDKSSTFPTKKQLHEEFPLYDIEEILDNFVKADLIYKAKKQEADENS